MSALMISTINVKDPTKFQEYLTGTQQIAKRYGAEMLVRGKADRFLTGGDSDHELVVVVRFPNIENLDRWYASEEYQALVPFRKEGAEMAMTSYRVG